MSASYCFLCVPAVQSSKIISRLTDFLSQRGMKITNLRTQSEAATPLRFKTNKVLFVSPPTGPWVQIAGWPSELEIDFRSWYLSNPLALQLSLEILPVLFFWTFGGGRAVGYSIFEGGSLVESQSVGTIGGIDEPPFSSSGGSRIAAVLNDQAFHFREFTQGLTKDYELAVAMLAKRLGCKWHLLDIMDLVDGEGGIAIEEGKRLPLRLDGWTAIEYATL